MKNAGLFAVIFLMVASKGMANFNPEECSDDLANIVKSAGKMWPYNFVPREAIAKEYGFKPSDKFLEHLREASVRLSSGGSGSFVSKSLIVTNHHVARSTLNEVSSPEHDYVKNGFLAQNHGQEIKAKDLEVNVLKEMTDVSDQVQAALKDIPPEQAERLNKARREIIGHIEKEAEAATGMKAEVVSLYKGGRYHLYLYKRYTDIRLVFAPESSIAFFGGDPANFEFPRADLDVAFFRVYENDKPVEVEHFLKVSQRNLKDGDLVFVSGHPGNTNRLFTTSALEYAKDFSLPFSVDSLKRRIANIEHYRSLSEEHKRQADEDYFGLTNSYKVYAGETREMNEGDFFGKRANEEKALRDRVSADPQLHQYADAWDIIAQAQKEKAKNFLRYNLFEGKLAFDTSLFSYARHLVRLAVEDQKPNGERLKEYQDSKRHSLVQTLTADVPLYKEFEGSKLVNALSYTSEVLGSSDPTVKAILEGAAIQKKASELVGLTQLDKREVREALLKGGPAVINASQDPMIILARLVDGESRALRKTMEENVETPEAAAYQKIANAQFAIFGTSITPDATFTLRLTYGLVRGYTDPMGTQVPPFTVIEDAYRYAAKNGNKDPWELPQRWVESKSKLALQTPFNFVAKADTIGGNSGSPTVDINGDLVGLLFDGNQYDFLKRYTYDDDSLGRSVNVDIRAVMESLKTVYHADGLVKELTPGK